MVVDYLSSQPNRAGYQVSTKQGSGPREAAKIGRQIIDQTEPFNASHATSWHLPHKPTVTRR